jgi:signal transduction histidine kinase
METHHSEALNSIPFPPCDATATAWPELLRAAQRQYAETLQLHKLFLFELDRGLGGPPLLLLQATLGVSFSEARLALNERDLALLDQADGGALALDTGQADARLESLASFAAAQGSESALVAPLRHNGQLQGCLVGLPTQPGEFSPTQRSFFSLLAAHLAVMAESARLREETAFRLSEAMSLQAVSSALVEERSLDAVLAMVIDEASRLTDASDALVLLLEPGGEWFRVSARRGAGVAGLASGRLSVQNSLNGRVVKTGRPLISEDAMSDPRANQDRARSLGVHGVVIAPLRIRDTTIGTIALHNKRGGPFTRSDVEALCSFANQAAIVIDNARLFSELLSARDEVQQKALELQELLAQTINTQEDERRRMAADIHDRVVPLIVGGLYEAQACAQAPGHAAEAREQLDLIQQLLDDAVEETRATIWDLWPATLDQAGLVPALRRLLRIQQKRAGIAHHLRVYGTPCRLRRTARIVAYRIVQEAVNNVLQHAAASSVEVSLRYGPRRIRVAIRDDGKGFDILSVMHSVPESHYGLIGMRERAMSIGGTLNMESVPGEGSVVTLDVDTHTAAVTGEGQ